MLMGLGASLQQREDQLSQSILLWTQIDYEVLFTVFLPGLLFKDSLETNTHLFAASIWQLLALAFPLVLASTMLTGLVAMFIFPYGWSFYQSLTLGCILAATDPVAVASLLNEVGAPPRLKVHVSGESLLNDGSAVVFFFVFGGIFLSELGIEGLAGEVTIGEAFAVFFRMSLGGVSVGLAFAIGLVFILYKLDRRMEHEETVLQVAATVTVAYLSFYTSEVVCKMSGVIAVVTCGLTTKAFGGGMISDWQVMNSFWGLLEHLLNTVIFALGGIVFGEIIVRMQDDGTRFWAGQDWAYLIVLYIFVNIIRFFLNFSFYPINTRIGLGTNWQEVVFASWGGLRGAVGITLALALDNAVFAATEDEAKQELTTKLFGMVGGISLLTLIINGSSCGPILEKLGLADTSASRKRIVVKAEEATRRRILDDFLNLMTDERFYFVDFALVRYHVPLLKDVTANDLKIALEENKESVHPNVYKSPNLEHVLPYFKDTAGLRTYLAKSRMEFFSSGVHGSMAGPIPRVSRLEEGLEAVTEDAVQDEAALAAAAELVKDTRVMFVELLRAAYTAQIKDGELDPREYDGFLVYALFQGLDFAQEAVAKGGPLCDWSSMDIGTSKLVYKAEHYVGRVFGCCCTKKESPKQRMDALKDTEPFRYQQLRLDVLRSLSFIDAHKEAQERLQEEFGDEKDETTIAFRTVMAESRAEVRKARDILVSKNKKNLKHVISHYLCTILSNKAARYINVLYESGVLLQREVRHFLEEIDHHIREIRKCPLDKHPGSLDFADEAEVQDWRRSRRRTKQKSFL
mmetsp:Transcript_51975/g.155981  ORF Transcript_51975/g.155981 Transcript_51975/m.155981 type:complete len:801 (-) Transcript_51975:183-2585(-)